MLGYIGHVLLIARRQLHENRNSVMCFHAETAHSPLFFVLLLSESFQQHMVLKLNKAAHRPFHALPPSKSIRLDHSTHTDKIIHNNHD